VKPSTRFVGYRRFAAALAAALVVTIAAPGGATPAHAVAPIIVYLVGVSQSIIAALLYDYVGPQITDSNNTGKNEATATMFHRGTVHAEYGDVYQLDFHLHWSHTNGRVARFADWVRRAHYEYAYTWQLYVNGEQKLAETVATSNDEPNGSLDVDKTILLLATQKDGDACTLETQDSIAIRAVVNYKEVKVSARPVADAVPADGKPARLVQDSAGRDWATNWTPGDSEPPAEAQVQLVLHNPWTLQWNEYPGKSLKEFNHHTSSMQGDWVVDLVHQVHFPTLNLGNRPETVRFWAGVISNARNAHVESSAPPSAEVAFKDGTVGSATQHWYLYPSASHHQPHQDYTYTFWMMGWVVGNQRIPRTQVINGRAVEQTSLHWLAQPKSIPGGPNGCIDFTRTMSDHDSPGSTTGVG
jgi:hypothetical protein